MWLELSSINKFINDATYDIILMNTFHHITSVFGVFKNNNLPWFSYAVIIKRLTNLFPVSIIQKNVQL